MTTSFGTRLMRAVSTRGPLCVGIDPHPELIEAWGLDPDLAGLERFAMTCVEALAGHVAAVKPQSAFFEVYGSAGIAVLEKVVAAARADGGLAVLDVKRGDIGSTMSAYARAYLDDTSPLAADAVTLSPYLGFGSLDPAIERAQASGRGVFVLALTSNSEGVSVQRARGPDGRSVAQTVVDQAAVRNAGARPLGSVGLVVGATRGRSELDLTALNGPVLAPGLGAQGGTVDALGAVFGSTLRHVLPSSSRDVLRHGPDPVRLREAALRLRDSLSAAYHVTHC